MSASRNSDPLDGKPYSLEWFQRDALRQSDDEIEFSEVTLARALRSLVAEMELKTWDRLMILAFADGLDNNEAPWRLELKGDKQGPKKLHHEKTKEQQFNGNVYFYVQSMTQIIGRKAAIIDAMTNFKIGRSTVYRCLNAVDTKKSEIYYATGFGYPQSRSSHK